MDNTTINSLFSLTVTDNQLKDIYNKILNEERVTPKEGIYLFYNAELSHLGTLANYIREKRHGNKTYFNKNFHIEPTNICVFDCKFCSYSRFLREKDEYDAWELSEEDIYNAIRNYEGKDITEVHIVGGVHPKMGLAYFKNLIENIKQIRPDIHVKAFTAVELDYMCKKAKVSYEEGLKILKDAGQGSLPGGGAEIFDEDIRVQICKDKCTSEQWLQMHEAAHKVGMPSNATMLYGHLEKYEHLIDHMNRLRNLQDKTGGFNAFIPLKFRNKNNQMSNIEEVSIIEDLKVYAMGRIFLDNFNHIKAYWPMIGRKTTQLLLSFGVNDIDGTVDDSTKIYTMAGAEEQKPTMTSEQMIQLIKEVGRKPIERDSIYNELNDYSEPILA
ncbi:MAG: aminofutalosine synthase MqnE [Flavobacteriales bacterium]|nr:aminofutalosine synthase MqnE [Flavobacteriales bacterium]MCW8913866.1 aminofutalosine synthase MqnE [Flavobacteriales bacterium]MCW8937431.1 aminofutalosine synthase MqnE [Flavobacteriales bacterium]MCW8940635.1 aminofutalosine synthase MqnE [Flavobacteriales bacterium]MCW8969091.1 aminofutalosine synthase MqnE [Flavobacteriales bacterium]